MTTHDATIRLLSDRTIPQLRQLLIGEGKAMQKLLTKQYKRLTDPHLSLDSQEASENATLVEQTTEHAARQWRKLSPAEQKTLLKVVERAGGDPEMLEEEMQLRSPI